MSAVTLRLVTIGGGSGGARGAMVFLKI